MLLLIGSLGQNTGIRATKTNTLFEKTMSHPVFQPMNC
jgi:hypothetical protein